MGRRPAGRDRARRRHDRRHAGTSLIRALLTLAGLLCALPAWAASLPAVESNTFMVVSAHRLASEAGAEMLRKGGNAIDAAVAIGYAEAVVNPCCGNIGGGGFLVAHLVDGHNLFLNFRETAPAAATADMYETAANNPVQAASILGWRAVGVPGTVLGLDTALARYGTMTRAAVMAPAIRLAREGFVLGMADAEMLRFPALAGDVTARDIFRDAVGGPLRPGQRLVQSALAETLDAIATNGPNAFYHGRIPQAVERAAAHGGGVITAADFAAYTVTEGAPVSCTYRGYQILSAPPPSSGGTTLCEILNILSGYDLHKLGFHSAASVHLMAEAMRHAYFDRNTLLGDPAFVKNPLDRLLSPDYAAKIRGEIGPRAAPSAEFAATPPPEKPETTHYSVIDQAGNAVAVTYTLNGAFGANVMAPGTGFLLNDEMDDFTTRPGRPNMFGLVQGQANAIAPGKRPLSSMSPTIVLRDGHVAMVLGSPGGPRIITITLETLLNLIDYHMSPQEAVDAPRLHLQWEPDKLFAEPYALSPDTAALLRGMGYTITDQRPWGAAELIVAEPGPRFLGANDPRRPMGLALGN